MVVLFYLAKVIRSSICPSELLLLMSLQMSTPLPFPRSSSQFFTATSHVPNCSPLAVNFLPIETKPTSTGSSSSSASPENEGVSGIKVPRQRYIAASKSQLLDAITTTMFNSPDEAHQFRHVSLYVLLLMSFHLHNSQSLMYIKTNSHAAFLLGIMLLLFKVIFVFTLVGWGGVTIGKFLLHYFIHLLLYRWRVGELPFIVIAVCSLACLRKCNILYACERRYPLLDAYSES